MFVDEPKPVGVSLVQFQLTDPELTPRRTTQKELAVASVGMPVAENVLLPAPKLPGLVSVPRLVLGVPEASE